MKTPKNRAMGWMPAHTVSKWAKEAEALFGQGNYQSALNVAGNGLAHTPDDPMLWNLCAAAAHGLGHLQDAEQFWRTALIKDPGFVKAQYNLGVMFLQQDRLIEAEAALRQVIAMSPNHATALDSLGSVLMKLDKRDEATTLIHQALRVNPRLASAHINLGVIQADQWQRQEAMASFSQAIACDSRQASAYGNRGYLHIELGDFAAAEADLRRAIRLDPNLAEAYFNLTILDIPKGPIPWLSELEAAYGRKGSMSPSRQSFLEFAMGKVREAQGRFDDAFAAYAAGNALHFQTHPFDEAREDRWLAATQERYSSDVLAMGGLQCDEGERDPRTPVFIVGMPRSGTTLLEQILASHSAVFGAGELPTLGNIAKQLHFAAGAQPNWERLLPRLRKLGKNYLDEVWKRAPDSPIIIDKLPGNFRLLGLLHLMLPQARIIHAMRDPVDTCLSCYFMRFKTGHSYSYDLPSLGRYYQRYLKVMEHWRRALPPGKMIEVRYEDVVSDAEVQVRRVLDFLGLPWDPACLKFHESKRAVATASVTQVRQKLYSSSQGRWRRFEAHLGPLLDELPQPSM